MSAVPMQSVPIDLGPLWEAINQHALVSITDLAGRITYANNNFVRLSGYRLDELIGQNHRIIKSSRQDQAFWAGMWKTISSGQLWQGEVCNRARDGSMYWVKAQISPILDAQGRIKKYLSIRTDISAQKKAADDSKLAQALQAANQNLTLRKFYLRAILDNVPYEIWLKDAQGRYQTVNRHLADACGWASPEAAIGLTDHELLPAALATVYQRIDCEVMHNRQQIDREEPDIHNPGRWVEVLIKPIFNDAGEVSGTLGMSHDISDRKLAQDQLQVRTLLLDTILDLSPDGFVSFDLDRRVKYANPAFTRLTHIGVDQIIDRDEQILADLLASHCSPSVAFSGFDAMRQCSGDGNRRLLELSRGADCVLELTLRQSHAGQVSQILHLRDVSHETVVDRMKSEFLTTAAHELRTPMASIYGFAEILATQDLDAASRTEFTSVLFKHTAGMVAVLNDLLDLARIEARRGLDFVYETISVQDVTLAAVKGLKLPPGRQTPVLKFAPEPLRMRVDARKIVQAIQNVLSNAYKYSPAGGDVTLEILSPRSLPDRAQQIGVRITDHGIGMTLAQQSHVYERFYRADSSGKTLGTGLGMSIVHEIVSLHGGTIDLVSRLGLGSSVTLWLPAAQEHRANTHHHERLHEFTCA